MCKPSGGLKETQSDHLPLPCDHVAGVAGSALEQLSVSGPVRCRVGSQMGLKVVPYVFRHSGPSADALEHRRNLTEIQ